MSERAKKGRPVINRALIAAEKRLADINAGLLACYETIEVGKAKKTRIEEKIRRLKEQA